MERSTVHFQKTEQHFLWKSIREILNVFVLHLLSIYGDVNLNMKISRVNDKKMEQKAGYHSVLITVKVKLPLTNWDL